MLVSIGDFIFSIDKLSFQKIQRTTQFTWASNNRVGQRSAKQFLGPGEDTQTIEGWVTTELCDGSASLAVVRDMGGDGNAYAFVDGTGGVHGLWVIESVSESGTLHYPNGQARKIEFSISLTRVDDDSLQQEAYIPPDWGYLA